MFQTQSKPRVWAKKHSTFSSWHWCLLGVVKSAHMGSHPQSDLAPSLGKAISAPLQPCLECPLLKPNGYGRKLFGMPMLKHALVQWESSTFNISFLKSTGHWFIHVQFQNRTAAFSSQLGIRTNLGSSMPQVGKPWNQHMWFALLLHIVFLCNHAKAYVSLRCVLSPHCWIHSACIAIVPVAEKACSSTRVLAAKKSWPDKKKLAKPRKDDHVAKGTSWDATGIYIYI